MHKSVVAAALSVLVIFILAVFFPTALSAILLVSLLSLIAIFTFRRFTEEKNFVTYLFLGALLIRIAFGIIVHAFDLRMFFGSDAFAYDFNGSKIVDLWLGGGMFQDATTVHILRTEGTGWGMNYLVAVIYLICGKDIFTAQSFCAVVGAATAPMVFYCAHSIFRNINVAKMSGLAVAFFPSFIIWSSQLLKDGLIIFLLVLTMTMVLQLHVRFRYSILFILIFSLAGILSLRFYIFYMVAVAAAGSFVVGETTSTGAITKRILAMVVIGLGLTYLGVVQTATSDFGVYGSLQQVQASRSDLATAESGFGTELDVSTFGGALTAIPVGFAYLMFAPFPWEVKNFRQTITLPEVLLWWLMVPLMVAGLWYTIKYRMRRSLPILIFSLMLTLAYSLLQGNVGTAYRHRAQIQVFLFIFVAVGFTLLRERRENRKLIGAARRNEFARRMRERVGSGA